MELVDSWLDVLVEARRHNEGKKWLEQWWK